MLFYKQKPLKILSDFCLSQTGDFKENGWKNTAHGNIETALTALTKRHAKELVTSDKEDFLVKFCCP